MSLEDLPPALKDILHAQLDAHERIEWIGQPVERKVGPESVLDVVFGTIWLACVVTFLSMFMANFRFAVGDVFAFICIAVFGLLPGLYMVFGPKRANRIRRRTAFVITDRRAMILDGRKKLHDVKHYPPEKLTNSYRKERKNGVGDVLFDVEWRSDSEGGSSSVDFGFMEIADVRAVHKRIKELAKKANETTTLTNTLPNQLNKE